MNIYLDKSEYKFSAEQSLMKFMPNERPEYGDNREGDYVEIKFSTAEIFTTCTVKIVKDEKTARAVARCKNELFIDENTKNRYHNRILKTAFYRAVISLNGLKPEWGSITGVRPVKLMEGYISDKVSEKSAKKSFQEDFFVSDRRTDLCYKSAIYATTAKSSLDERDICLYIGIPFCPTRCAYCSFVSQATAKNMELIEPFMEALMIDIEATAEAVRTAKLNVRSIYMGGGTPTTLSAEQLERLCGKLENEFNLKNLHEYTVEAGRPDTITRAKLEVLRKFKVNRISVNPQTMQDKTLDLIGRFHTSQDIVDCLNLVREVGGFAVNMDMIAGLPNETVADFEDSLEKVIALNPENITVHTLAMKKGSMLTLGRVAKDARQATAEDISAMLDYAETRLKSEKFEPYYLYCQKFMAGNFENVGWTKSGFENFYNICMMEELCGILSMGGGASTKLVSRGKLDTKNKMYSPKYPKEYIESIDKIVASKQKIIDAYK